MLIFYKPGYDKRFMKFLIRRLKMLVLSEIDNKKFSALSDYATEIYNTRIDMRKVVSIAVNNIVFDFIDGTYYLTINTKQVYPETDIPVYQLSRLLNFGNSEVKGYPLFTKNFNLIKANLAGYYKYYVNSTRRL